jgi:hypothetical protein
MAVIDSFIVNQCLGPSFDGFDYLPAEETRGGHFVSLELRCGCCVVHLA